MRNFYSVPMIPQIYSVLVNLPFAPRTHFTGRSWLSCFSAFRFVPFEPSDTEDKDADELLLLEPTEPEDELDEELEELDFESLSRRFKSDFFTNDEPPVRRFDNDKNSLDAKLEELGSGDFGFKGGGVFKPRTLLSSAVTSRDRGRDKVSTDNNDNELLLELAKLDDLLDEDVGLLYGLLGNNEEFVRIIEFVLKK